MSQLFERRMIMSNTKRRDNKGRVLLTDKNGNSWLCAGRLEELVIESKDIKDGKSNELLF